MENSLAAATDGRSWSKESLFGVMIEALFQQGLLTEQQRAEVRAALRVGNAENLREE